MLNVLRLTSLISVLLAVTGIFVLNQGLKSDPESEFFSGQMSPYQQNRVISEHQSELNGICPLVTQARLFALRIDPPAVVLTIPTKDTGQSGIHGEILPKEKTIPLAAVSLEGIAGYCRHPQKSLVLLHHPIDGYRWCRIGEVIGRFSVAEINERSVILLENRQNPTEVFLPVKHETSLLRHVSFADTILNS